MTTVSKSVALVKPETYLRSSILGTQVINQANASRLGIVDQIWVDPEQMQVLVFQVSRQAFSAGAMTVELSQINALGRDAILVGSDEVFDDLDLSGLARITGCEVLTTETGLVLGKVKDFLFNSASGLISELVLSRLGIPLLSGYIDSTYRMRADEVLSVGERRIIVAEGTETRLISDQKSVFERLNIATPAWMRQREENVRGVLPRAYDDREEDLYEEEYEEYEEDYEEDLDADLETFDEIYAEDEPEREPIPRRPRAPRPSSTPAPPPAPATVEPESEVTNTAEPPPPSEQQPEMASPAAAVDPNSFQPVPPPEATAWEDQPEQERSSSSS